MIKEPPILQRNISLHRFTSWRVGGTAEYFCQPQDIDELIGVLKWCDYRKISWTVLGGGTNSLISDRGVPGCVLSFRKFVKPIVEEETGDFFECSAMAGTTKSALMRVFLKHELAPALFLSGLPGDIGGGVVMNAGVSENLDPREFCEIVSWIEVVKSNQGEFEVQRISTEEIQWSYRKSLGWQPGVITQVGFRWPKGQRIIGLADKVREAQQLRKSKQPLELPNCGSVFKNPEGEKAGRLIEECGLKGYSEGGAQVSEKHANFIVNINQASAEDIYKIIQHVQSVVKTKKQISLETEIRFFGFEDPSEL